MRFQKPCATARCPNLTHEKHCPEHAVETQLRYERNRGSAASRGYDRTWRKVRVRYLRSVGWRCEDCGDRPFDTSQMHVHHIDQEPTGPRRFDPANLSALCIHCHSKLHASEGAA